MPGEEFMKLYKQNGECFPNPVSHDHFCFRFLFRELVNQMCFLAHAYTQTYYRSARMRLKQMKMNGEHDNKEHMRLYV